MMIVSTEERAALESLLRWYAAMGVDIAVDKTPHDRFIAPAPPRDDAQRAVSPAPARPFDVTTAPAEDLAREAAARAAAAHNLDALRDAFATQPGLGLATSARMIFSGGKAGSKLMLMGAAPESDDERQGEAFSGQHGRLLDAMLHAMGLDRAQVYLTHVVPWRPPGNRPPSPFELSLCLPYTRRHIALAAPDILLCFGERATQPLLDSREPIGKLRGRWLIYEDGGTKTKMLATFSPSYLLRQPLQKRRTWADLQMAMEEMGLR